jgi:hypothetical protein
MKPSFGDIADKLRWVGISRNDYDLSLFPDFLIIGPQRTGTTWLYKHLSRHPQVYMPARKELFYFSYVLFPPGHPSSVGSVDSDLGWYLEHFRPAKKKQLLGEATATYAAALNESIIAEIAMLNPDIKVLTMVRDPIERAWSHAKLDLSHLPGRPVDSITQEEWMEAVTDKYQIKCGNYERFHAIWRQHIPEENFFVGRFVDLENDPAGLLIKVFQFLGIEASRSYVKDVKARVNPSVRHEIPPALLKALEGLFADESRRLKDAGLI